MIDIKKASDNLKESVKGKTKVSLEEAAIGIHIAIAEQLKRIADVMQTEKNERRENLLREVFRNRPQAAQQRDDKSS